MGALAGALLALNAGHEDASEWGMLLVGDGRAGATAGVVARESADPRGGE